MYRTPFVTRACSIIGMRPLAARSLATGTGLPGDRLPVLRALLEQYKGQGRVVRILETHNGLTGLIAETASVEVAGKTVEFDGMWSSSLTASAAKGKPDIETVDTTERLALVAETLDVTSKPMIYDADTGGKPEIFRFTVRSLEKLGVSAAIIEDKAGLKQNSLFGTERKQELETIENFCEKIKAGQAAKTSPEFMIVARLEALIAGHGQAEALKRAIAFTEAGADAIMIHSKEKSPDEVLEFLAAYHGAMGEKAVPVVAVPTTYNVITEAELYDAGVSIVIYANHMLRAAYPSMMNVAESILTNTRSLEADSDLLPVKKVITMIDENPLNPSLAPEKKVVATSPLPSGARAFSTAARSTGFGRAIGARSFSTQPPKSSVKGNAAQTHSSGEPAAQKPRTDGPEMIANTEGKTEPQVCPVSAYEHARAIGFNFFTGVPDSLLSPFCHVVAVEAEQDHVIAANEGSAIATAAGYHFATGQVPMVYLQNSGLGNAVNPIMSLAHKEVYGTPMVVVVGWRGCPGHKDEPQHVVQGRQTVAQLESLGVSTVIMPNEQNAALESMQMALDMAKAEGQPVALLVPPKTFTPAKKAPREISVADQVKPTREEAIETLLTEFVGPNDAVVGTTGFCSREIYETRLRLGQPHESDFLSVGSMGHALSIAHGIALAQPERTVWCLDGDGAALMHLGNLATTGALNSSYGKLSNLRHIILNNRVHDSVGAQPTAATYDGAVDFPALGAATGYAAVGSAPTATDIGPKLEELNSTVGPKLLEVQLKLGTRSDLGRPKTSTLDAAAALRNFLQK